MEKIVVQTNKLHFSGHETFPLRYPWPAKGVRSVQENPDLFSQDDALVTLGVGKNMVRSIRHWGNVLGIIERVSSIGLTMQATELGNRIFGPDGWDPFLENPGTLWLLHWQLVHRRDQASSWHFLFTHWGSIRFSKEQLIDWLLGIAQQTNSRASRPSLKRDVDVLLRTYVPSKTSRDLSLEETFDSPLVELGLLHEVDKGIYSFNRGPKPSLPMEIFLFALLNFWNEQAADRKSLSFENILYGPGSPGGAFKLTENALAELLDQIPQNCNLHFDETAGMRNLYGNPDVSSESLLQLLEQYYTK